MKIIRQLVVFTFVISLSLLSNSITAQTEHKQTPEYLAAYESFVEDYNKALNMISLLGDTTEGKAEQYELTYIRLMKQSKVHFQVLVNLTPEGDEKRIMNMMLLQLDTEEYISGND